MRTHIFKAGGLLALLVCLALESQGDNPCVESGPHYSSWGCVSNGTLVPGYGLTPTNIVVNVGQFVSVPSAYGLSITNGKQSSWVYFDCPNTPGYPGYTAYAPINYTFGGPIFTPPLPQTIWTPGTYVYTGQVVATGSPCSPLTNTVGTVTVTVISNNPDVLFDVDLGGQTNSRKTGYAAIGDSASDFWNGYAPPGQASGTLANLKTAEGYVSTVGFQVTNLFSLGTNGSPDVMYNDYLYTNSGSATLTFTNLPAGTWNVYLYSDDGNFSLSAGGTSYGSRTCHDLPLSSPLAWQPGVQYVVFTNVTVSGGQSVVVSVAPGANGAALISGLQIASINHLAPGPLSGIVGWWKAENNTLDSFGTNNGVGYNISYTNGEVGQAFHCNSSRVQIVDTPAFQLTNAMTIEGWVRPRGNGYVIFWRGDNRAGLDPYIFSMQGNSNLLFQVCDASNDVGAVGTGVNIPYNQWSYVAGNYLWQGSSALMQLYVNGSLVSQTNTTVRPFAVLQPTQNPLVCIGNINSGGFPFNGDIDEITLWSRALSQAEIQAIYNEGSAGKSTNSSVMADSDYDGVSDLNELADRTDPNDANSVLPIELGYWPFDNTNTWTGNAGQLPLAASNVVGVASWDTNAVLMDSTNPAILCYRDMETNGNANINLRCGTVQFWFKPDWAGTNLGGGGPGTAGRLIEVGSYNPAFTNGWWSLYTSTNGSQLLFGSSTNGGGQTNLTAGIAWLSNQWHQVVLTYTPSNSALYVDGQPATNGAGSIYFPNLSERANGFRIGSDATGLNQARGAFDNLETFNYPLSAGTIASNYQSTVASASVPQLPPARIAGGRFFSVALECNGTVWTWGDNTYGQLGDGTTTDRTHPVEVTNLLTAGPPYGPPYVKGYLSNVVAVAGGDYHTLALLLNGTILAWGSDSHGQLGNYSTTDSHRPIQVVGPTGVGALSNVVALAGGWDHSVALLNDGSVWAWGDNSFAEIGDGTLTDRHAPVQVSGLSNIVAIAGGSQCYHHLALQSNGNLWQWGGNPNPSVAGQVTGLSNIVSIACDDSAPAIPANLALESNGTVWAWGTGSPAQIAGLNGIVAIAGGGYAHFLALKFDGTVWAWGFNNHDQLGNGTTTDSSTPVQVIGVSQAVGIAIGGYHSFAVLEDSGLMAWGDDEDGEIGNGEYNGAITPVAISSVSPCTAPEITIQPAGETACAGTTVGLSVAAVAGSTMTYQWNKNGTNLVNGGEVSGATSATLTLTGVSTADAGNYTVNVTGWGGSVSSQPATLTVNYPPIITTQPQPQTVAAGYGVDFGVAAIGAAPVTYQWMYAGNLINGATNQTLALTNVQSGQAGTYTVLVSDYCGSTLSATAVLTVTNSATSVATKLAATGNGGGFYSLILRCDGTVWSVGAMGATPTQVSGLAGVTGIAAGWSHALALKSDRTVQAWGNNFEGQLGTGGTTAQSGLVVVSGITNAVGVAAGEWTSCALKSDGTVWMWGGYQYLNATNAPVAPVTGLSNITSIVGSEADEDVFFALRSDGTVWQWNDTYGIPAAPTQVTNLTGITAIVSCTGNEATLALKSDGTVWAWGDNRSGELGNGSYFSSSTPVQVSGLSGVTAIAGGGFFFNIALKSDGTVWSWGDNTYGELGDGATGSGSTTPVQVSGLSGVTAIAAGSMHCLALKSDSSIWTWGDGTNMPEAIPGLSACGSLAVTITTQPLSQTVYLGSTVIFDVTVTGMPLTYQWQKNEVNVSGATDSTLLLTNVASGDAGAYTVIVTGVSGNVTSSAATLVVVSVGSLAPVNNTNCTLVSSNATLQTWTVPVSTNPAVSNLEILAIPSPSLPVSSLPAGWSLDGLLTNIEYVSITNTGIHTVVCTAGTSAITNVILVSAGTNFNSATNLPGLVVNLHANNQGYLQMNSQAGTAPLPFLNVSKSLTTLVRIQVSTNISSYPSKIVGEYYTTPNNVGWPSRTTVDRYGNVWVANRADGENGGATDTADSPVQPDGSDIHGSVTEFGIVIGGTRGDKLNVNGTNYTFSPDPDGEYLQPPFTYNTCIDRDGDGLIHTSPGLDSLGVEHVYQWDDSADVSNATDEAIVRYVRTVATDVGTIAIDTNNNLWVGGIGNHWHELIDSGTGIPITGQMVNPGGGGFAGLLDPSNTVWSAQNYGNLYRFTPSGGVPQAITVAQVADPGTGFFPSGSDSYFGSGLGVDPVAGDVWAAVYDNDEIYHFRDNGFSEFFDTPESGSEADYKRGTAVDAKGNVWVADTDGNYNGMYYVSHLLTNGQYVGSVPLILNTAQGVQPYGVSIDAQGMVWANCYGQDPSHPTDNSALGYYAMRIDPTQGAVTNINGTNFTVGQVVELVDLNLCPNGGADDMGDLTGYRALNTPERSGFWDFVQDSGAADRLWISMTKNASIPPGSSLITEVRAANRITDLPSWPFKAVTGTTLPSGIKGRYLEVRVTMLDTLANDQGPTLTNLVVQWTGTSTSGLQITNQPENQMVYPGDTATFSVQASTQSGATIASYQWRANDVNLTDGGNISGSSTATLNINNTQYTNAARYSVRVTDSTGTVLDSAEARLHVMGNPPVILQQPELAATPPYSATTILTAAATVNPASVNLGSDSGYQPVYYQWMAGGQPIAGATGLCSQGTNGAWNTILQVPNMGCSNAPNYSVSFWNQYGEILSQSLGVDDGTNPVATIGSVTFTAHPIGGGGWNYQWYYLSYGGSTNLIVGANSNYCTIPTDQTGNNIGAGTYILVATNATGGIAGVQMELTSSSPTGPGVQADDVQNMTVDVTYTMAGVAIGPWSAQWSDNNGNQVNGATNSSYTIYSVGCQVGGTNSSPWGNYTAYVADACGNQSQVSASLQMAKAVVFTNVTFTVHPITGTGWNYHWYYNGSAIGGAASASYTVTMDATGNNSGAGTYMVVATNTSGGTATGQMELTSSYPGGPSMQADPSQNATMDVTLGAVQTEGNGIGTWAYQWSGPNGNIANATNSSYTISPLDCADSGNYQVQIIDGCSDSTSVSATLSSPAPPITISNAIFTVHPTAGSGWTYKWYKNGGLISGATASSYAAVMDNNGDELYSVVATNTSGGNAGAQMEVTSSNPGGPTVQADGAQNMTVDVTYTVAGADASATYQWADNNGNQVSGATGNSYTIYAIGCPVGGTSTSPWGNYTVYITDACGNSQIQATLQIVPMVVFTNTTFTVHPITGTGWNYHWYYDGSVIGGATSASYTVAMDPTGNNSGVGTYLVVATNSSGATATSQMELTGVTPASPSVQADTMQNATMDVTLAAVQTQGNGIGTWVYQWSGPGGTIVNATSSSYTISSVNCANSGSYQVMITDGCGDPGSASASLMSPAPAATITNTTFIVHPTTGTGWTYKWYKNGGLIVGATASSYTAVMDNNGDELYNVVATNASGGNAGAQIELTSSSPGGPVVQADGAQNMTVDVVYAAANPGAGTTYQWYDNNGNQVSGATGSGYTVYAIGCPVGGTNTSPWGNYTVSIADACGSSQVYGNLQLNPLVVFTNVTFTLYPTVGSGWNYHWYYNGVIISGATSASYTVPMDPTGNNGGVGIYLAVATNSSGGMASGQMELTSSYGVGPSIQADPTQNATMGLTLAAVQTRGSGIGTWTYQWSGANGPIANATNLSYVISPVACSSSGGYQIQINDGCGDSTSASCSLTVGMSPTDALSVTNMTFTVHPTGGSGWTNQWYKNGSSIAGATNSSYTVALDPSGGGSGVGTYTVNCTGLAGATAQAQFEIVNSFAFGPTAQVDAQYTTHATVDVEFTGLSQGIGTWIDQWYYGYYAFGSPIAGGTNLSYTITNVVEGDAGYYTLYASPDNYCVSNNVRVTLNVNNFTPNIIGPVGQTVTLSSPATFTVQAEGAPPLSYQWLFNGTNISGATSSSYNIPSAAETNAGNYQVVVSNPYAVVTSSVAPLVVVSVASLSPTNNANCVLLSSNATLQMWTIPVSTDPTVSNLEIVATADPGLPPSSLPVGWSLDGVLTNITYVNITQPAVFTVTCTAGASAITNYIAVTLNGDVEADCSGDGPALLGYWSFNNAANPWMGNLGQEPLNASGLQNPASPWGGALQVDTNSAANLSYNYGEATGAENVHCLNGAVSFWFQPDWNGGIGPRDPARFIEMGDIDSTNGWWSLGVDFTGSTLAFQSASNGVLTTYFTEPITNWVAGNWYQLVLDYSAEQTSLYIDGALVQTGPGMVSYPTLANRMAYGFSIGSDHTGQNQIRGIIDEVQTYNCPLNADQIAAGYPGTNSNIAPHFINQPASQTVGAGGTATFSAYAIGSLPLTYQWQKNGQNLGNGGRISGATSAALTISNANLGDAGNYSVVAVNSLGVAASSNATLALISIAITSPQAGATFSVSNLDVLGTVTSSAQIQSVTVNGTAAFLNGNAFTAWYVPLIPGTNLLVVVAQDVNGNQNQTNITVMANTNQADPLILIPSVTEGNAPLTVNFSIDSSGLPGTVQSVTWDWQGDGIADLTNATLVGQSHTYGVGTYFPVVTVNTTQGTFSSGGGLDSDMEENPVTIVASIPPTNIWSLSVTNPVGVKANADGSVYVLTVNPSTFLLCASNGTIVRSMNLTGTCGGFDVDTNGNVYIAMTASNQVSKWNPDSGTSFTSDTSFGDVGYADVGYIGNSDGTSGSGSYQFNRPTGVAVSPDGTAIYVADSLNARVQKFTTANGDFLLSVGGFVEPAGITADTAAGNLLVADSGAGQVVSIANDSLDGSFANLGAMQASGDEMVVYVTDGTNVTQWDNSSYTLLAQVPASVGLNNPRSVSAWPSQIEQRVYIADYGNNRIVAVTFPGSDPIGVWNDMKQAIADNDLPLAMSYFSYWTSSKYDAEYQAVGLSQLSTVLNQLSSLQLVEMTDSFAYYTVTATLNGVTITYYISFANEDGTWKISSF